MKQLIIAKASAEMIFIDIRSRTQSWQLVIGDACASTPTVLSVTMPWELPGINLILGEEASVVPTPILGPVLVSPREFTSAEPATRVSRVEHIRGSYQEVIDFRLTSRGLRATT